MIYRACPDSVVTTIISRWCREVWPDVEGRIFEPVRSDLTLELVGAARYSNLPIGGLPSLEVIVKASHLERIADADAAMERMLYGLVQPLIDTVDAYRGFMAIE